jgi:hypothetical protein
MTTRLALSSILAAFVACTGDPGAVIPDAAPPDAPASADAHPVAPTAIPCDVVSQDCSDPAYPKCTVVGKFTLAADMRQPLCVPTVGTKALGDGCVRYDPDWSSSALMDADDCRPGLYCTFGTCRRLCNVEADCDAGDTCGIGGLDSTPNLGICLKKCALFGSDCSAAESCDILSLVQGWVGPVCRPIGPIAVGAICGAFLPDCVANASCQSAPARCYALCDTYPGGAGAHPCMTDSCQYVSVYKIGFCGRAP